jgi:hypothetical protein
MERYELESKTNLSTVHSLHGLADAYMLKDNFYTTIETLEGVMEKQTPSPHSWEKAQDTYFKKEKNNYDRPINLVWTVSVNSGDNTFTLFSLGTNWDRRKGHQFA